MPVVLAAIIRLGCVESQRLCGSERWRRDGREASPLGRDRNESSTSLSFGFPFISHLFFFSTHPPYYGFVRNVYLRFLICCLCKRSGGERRLTGLPDD